MFKMGRIQIPVQRMNSNQGFRFYRLLPVMTLVLFAGLSTLNYMILFVALAVLALSSLISTGFLGFVLTSIVYSCGELVELAWPFFEYKNAEELKQLNQNLQKQFFLATPNNEDGPKS